MSKVRWMTVSRKKSVRRWSEVRSTAVSVRFFFFQAEDGIRDLTVTGVQTCALPISRRRREPPRALPEDAHSRRPALLREVLLHAGRPRLPGVRHRTRADRRARLLGDRKSVV